MIKIIETNLMYDNNIIGDFQSRIIEVESFDKYIQQIKNKEKIYYKCLFGQCRGYSLPSGNFEMEIKQINEYKFQLIIDQYEDNYKVVKMIEAMI